MGSGADGVGVGSGSSVGVGAIVGVGSGSTVGEGAGLEVTAAVAVGVPVSSSPPPPAKTTPMISLLGWSPDGSRIAFSSDRDGDFDVYVMNADGSGVTNLSDNPAEDSLPAWSPVP